jgi:hypothetical protein
VHIFVIVFELKVHGVILICLAAFVVSYVCHRSTCSSRKILCNIMISFIYKTETYVFEIYIFVKFPMEM